ncbi:MAG: hypothetical protein V4674_00520 [Patescibacteria group bacterium]
MDTTEPKVRRWTEDEDADVINIKPEQKDELARKLGRTEFAIRTRRSFLLKQMEPEERKMYAWPPGPRARKKLPK